MKINRGNVSVYAIVALMMGSLTAPSICATTATTSADDLLRQSAQALNSASSIQADFEEIDSYPGKYKDLAQRGSILLARPGRFRIHIQRFRRVSADAPWAASGNDTDTVSDGQTYSFAFLHPHSTQVRQEPATERNLRSALKSLPLLNSFYAEETAEGALPGQSGAATLLPSETWEGKSYQVVAYKVDEKGSDNSVDARAYVGDDHLIHRLIYRRETAQGTVTKEWNLRHIQEAITVPASAFAYTVPADATPLENSPRTELLAAGSDAPDFTAYDSTGKPVKLSDYKGKTVVLDFWATWCWPCNQSLPHTEAVVKSHQDTGVVALAVAIRDSKTGFDLWLSKHHYPDIRFVRDPAPQGQDVATTLYHVSTTPTAYVIDGDGKIVSSIEGFAGPSPALEAAIESALPQARKTAQK